MAHNAYIRAGNNWALSSAFLTVEITSLALQVYQSLNADLGGTWAPASVITIGGSGLTVTGETRLDDVVTADFGLNAICSFTSNASLAFGGTAGLVMGTGTLFLMQAGATATIGCPIAISGAATFSGAVTFSAGTHTYVSNTVAGPLSRTGLTTYSGTDGRRKGRTVANGDANVTYGNEVDTIFYSQTNGVNHGLTLRASSATAAEAGERIRVLFRRTPSTVGSLLVTCETGGTLIDFGTNGSTAVVDQNRGGADFEFDGTQWRVCNYWGTGTSVAAMASP